MSFKFKLNRKGVRELLNSEEVADFCAEVAADVAAKAGVGYETAQPHHTGQRVAVNVYAATHEAYLDNLEHNTLLKAIGGGATGNSVTGSGATGNRTARSSGGHNVREHTRRLKDGRVITVRAHTRGG